MTWGELNLTEGKEVAEIEARKQKGRDDALVVLHPLPAEMLRVHRKECSAAGVRIGTAAQERQSGNCCSEPHASASYHSIDQRNFAPRLGVDS